MCVSLACYQQGAGITNSLTIHPPLPPSLPPSLPLKARTQRVHQILVQRLHITTKTIQYLEGKERGREGDK